MQNSFNWPLIGHQKIQKFLQTSIANNSLTHAYLFHGPEKIGKYFTAEVFAKTLLCLHDGEARPCGRCSNCEQVDRKIFPDLYIIQRELSESTGKLKANISVKQIRELQEKISKRAFLNSYKIVIIKEAETMSQEASNSLLKTLEEPTQKTIFILISSYKQAILPTILSRTQYFKFLPLNRKEIYDYLVGKGFDRNKSDEISRQAQGRLKWALDYAKDNELWLEDQEEIQNILHILFSDNVVRFGYIEKITDKKRSTDYNKFLAEVISLVRDIVMIKLGRVEKVINKSLVSEIEKNSAKRDLKSLQLFIAQCEETKEYIKTNINPRLALENLILNF